MNNPLQEYLQIIQTLNEPLGDWRKGEIQIVTDPEQIMAMVTAKKVELAGKRANNNSLEPKDVWADVGIIADDPFFIVLRDAVLFPPKKGTSEPTPGFYIRTIYRNQLKRNLGICVFPITSDKKIVLNLAFRHSVRNWCVETPGTIGINGESREESLNRCIKSELGTVPKKITLVNEQYISERGLIDAFCPIYVVEVDSQNLSSNDLMISGHYLFNKDELKEVFKKGHFEHGDRKYVCGDSYTIAGLFYAEMFGLI